MVLTSATCSLAKPQCSFLFSRFKGLILGPWRILWLPILIDITSPSFNIPSDSIMDSISLSLPLLYVTLQPGSWWRTRARAADSVLLASLLAFRKPPHLVQCGASTFWLGNSNTKPGVYTLWVWLKMGQLKLISLINENIQTPNTKTKPVVCAFLSQPFFSKSFRILGRSQLGQALPLRWCHGAEQTLPLRLPECQGSPCGRSGGGLFN